MKFRTEFECTLQGPIINPSKPLIAVGSCFADNITSRMRQCLCNAVNPLGVLFNPLSIAKAIELCLLKSGDELFKQSLFMDGDMWHSWLFDSKFSMCSIEESVEKFHDSRTEFLSSLEKGGTLIITFGTSYCYFLNNEPKKIVANCHKQPAANFLRRRISIEEIINVWNPTLAKLKHQFQEIKVIFTVSPVRHIRDGLHENNLSKSILLLAIDQICSEHNFCHYFPAYEIVNDDLRDYRFYADDLVHPSVSAIEYIWEKFKELYIDKEGIAFLKEGEAVRKRMEHKPLTTSNKSAEKFNDETRRLYRIFLNKYPDALNV